MKFSRWLAYGAASCIVLSGCVSNVEEDDEGTEVVRERVIHEDVHHDGGDIDVHVDPD